MTDFTELNLSNQNIEKYKDNVDIIHLYDKDIYLIGTAHISQNSVDLAESTIREIMPDTVAIELCEKRYESLKDPDRWKKTDIIKPKPRSIAKNLQFPHISATERIAKNFLTLRNSWRRVCFNVVLYRKTAQKSTIRRFYSFTVRKPLG